jgi:predicted nucleic acid-binding protein
VILVDSSAWVEYDRATGSPSDERLTALIRSGGSTIAVTEPVLMEVLAGARNDAGAARLRRLLTSFSWIPVEAVADFDGAAGVYRSCRQAGVTPRGLIDCMIANIAMRTGSELLAADANFVAMASVVPLRVASTRE